MTKNSFYANIKIEKTYTMETKKQQRAREKLEKEIDQFLKEQPLRGKIREIGKKVHNEAGRFHYELSEAFGRNKAAQRIQE